MEKVRGGTTKFDQGVGLRARPIGQSDPDAGLGGPEADHRLAEPDGVGRKLRGQGGYQLGPMHADQGLAEGAPEGAVRDRHRCPAIVFTKFHRGQRTAGGSDSLPRAARVFGQREMAVPVTRGSGCRSKTETSRPRP
jgi:hypothetical protein